MARTLSKRFADELATFVNNPNMRSVKKSEYGVGTGQCAYYGGTVGKSCKGCFVGRFLPKAMRIDLDKKYHNEPIRAIAAEYEGLPDIVMDNLNLMVSLQRLHDGDTFWNKEGLTGDGKKLLKRIVQDNAVLKMKDFKKFLS